MFTTDTSSAESLRIKTKHREIDTAAVIAGLPEIPKDVLVKAAFNDIEDSLWQILISEDYIEVFADAARLLVTDIQGQLTEATAIRRAHLDVDADWMRRVVKVQTRLTTLATYLRMQVKALHREQHLSHRTVLAKAIQAHQESVLAEYEPTPADYALWGVLMNPPSKEK